MNPEVKIFGGALLHEYKQILCRMLPDKYQSNFYEKADGDFILICTEDRWCVFESSQHSVTKLAQLKQYKTLTCGFSSYDTLVLSSSTPEQAVVSLQRQIQSISGKVLEPGDFLIKKSVEYSDTAVLLCVAVLLLLDQKQAVFEF